MSTEVKTNSRARILYSLRRLEEKARTPEYEGCPYLAVQIELTDTEHPASFVASRVKQELEAVLRREAGHGGADDPEFVGRQLILVFDGTSARADSIPGRATAVAGTLLDAAGVR